MKQTWRKTVSTRHLIRNGEERVPVEHVVDVEIDVDDIADIIAHRAARNSTGRASWVSGNVRAKRRK